MILLLFIFVKNTIPAIETSKEVKNNLNSVKKEFEKSRKDALKNPLIVKNEANSTNYDFANEFLQLLDEIQEKLTCIFNMKNIELTTNEIKYIEIIKNTVNFEKEAMDFRRNNLFKTDNSFMFYSTKVFGLKQYNNYLNNLISNKLRTNQ
ncbi:hypothetical protein TUBRATIS_13460 [Tubulinosema ratisbonensis]|uniref:Uncharacterized protein n=1 Tax=Tubulinosema ratisbonensis TaxID=291195 RepID=A0A437AM55_9MICR|nr:hypothetical protein TUBRATIS_13460 [Tubulinosema ratisbonensis]